MNSPNISTGPNARYRKSLGQHFLLDDQVLDRIVAAAEIEPQELVVEIGPGTGALTRRLINCGAKVVAVELDPQLAATLSDRMGRPANLTVVEGDARSLDLNPLLVPETPFKVVGNLPYYAANPIIRRFLEDRPSPALMVVTVQEEVARNMTASPGTMGLLSVAVQYYAAAQMVCTIPPEAFRPPPKVTSAVVRLDIRPVPAVQVADEKTFFTVVRAGFSSPRKQLRNSLSHGLGISTSSVTELLAASETDGARRPATLSLDEWAAIYLSWANLSENKNIGIDSQNDGRR